MGRKPPTSAPTPIHRTGNLYTLANSMLLPTTTPGVIFKSLPDGAVLYDPAQEVYYGLNQVGEEVWQLLPPVSQTLDDLCGELHKRYPEVAVEMLRSDVAELLDDLRESGLVVARIQNPDGEPSHVAAP